jgi:hypothetical protein
MGAASAALRCAGASLTEAYYGVCGGVCGPSEIRSVKSMRLEGKRQSKHKLDERGILLITNAERPRQLG